MPVTRSAKKKLRQDIKREKQNRLVKKAVKDTIKAFKRNPSTSLLSKAFSLLDNARKKKIFQANKVDRLKGRLSKLLGKKSTSPLPKTKTETAGKPIKQSKSKKTASAS